MNPEPTLKGILLRSEAEPARMPLVEQAQISGRGEAMALVLPQECSEGTDRR